LPRSRSSQRSRQRLNDRATEAELALKKALEEAQEPFIFQYVIRTAESFSGFYVADFYLPKRKLLVELDGAPHATERGYWKDRLREEAIKKSKPKLTQLRFWNKQVLKDPNCLVKSLQRY
jgi:very-short-patch-repair endonuclease